MSGWETIKLNALVYENIAAHTGGEAFFNYLDEDLRQKDFMMYLFKLAKEKYNDVPWIPVLSGSFGCMFKQHLGKQRYEPLYFRGGLRYSPDLSEYTKYEHKIIGRRFIFFDDSFYKGRTRDAISYFLTKHHGRLLHTFVCYDGSQEKDDNVTSMFRYYDKFR